MIEVISLGLSSSSKVLAPLAYDMINEKNPRTSSCTLSDEIPLGLDWKKSFVTEIMFRPGLMDGNKADACLATALENRSLMASRGSGAVTCTPHDKPAALPPFSGVLMVHGLQVLS